MLFRLESRVRSVAVKKFLTNGRIWTRLAEAMHNQNRFSLPPDPSEWSAGKMSAGWQRVAGTRESRKSQDEARPEAQELLAIDWHGPKAPGLG